MIPGLKLLLLRLATGLQEAYDKGSPAIDAMMCLPFYIGAFCCLFFSAIFHTMTDCCGAADKFWTKCDYLGTDRHSYQRKDSV